MILHKERKCPYEMENLMPSYVMSLMGETHHGVSRSRLRRCTRGKCGRILGTCSTAGWNYHVHLQIWARCSRETVTGNVTLLVAVVAHSAAAAKATTSSGTRLGTFPGDVSRLSAIVARTVSHLNKVYEGWITRR